MGSGRSGPRGVGRCLPSPPDSAVPLRGPGWRVACRATVTLQPRPSGGGYPAVVVWAVAVCAVRVRALRLPGGGWEPPGRLWGVRACLWRVGAGCPVV